MQARLASQRVPSSIAKRRARKDKKLGRPRKNPVRAGSPHKTRFTSGMQFLGWKEREEAVVLWKWPKTYDPLVVYLPKTWLLTQGWLKHGRVSFYEVPSAKPALPAAA